MGSTAERQGLRDERLQDETSSTAVSEATAADHARSLDHDIEAVKRCVRERLGDRVRAVALEGSFARGEGCFWQRHGEVVPGNNLNFCIVTTETVSPLELEELRDTVLAETLVEAVVFNAVLVDALPRLPATIESIDLAESSRVVDGDPAAISGLRRLDFTVFPRSEAEKRLRSRLITLLEAYPSGRDEFRSFYRSAKAIFAGVDSILIRNDCYTASYRDKVYRLEGLTSDGALMELVHRALDIKLGGCLPADTNAMSFWEVALRFYLDCLLGLFGPPGAYRSERLANLLAGFHFQTTSLRSTARNLSRIFMHRNRHGSLQRLLLALAIDRDSQGPALDLEAIARRAGLGPTETWEELLEDAIDHWYRQPRLR